MKKYKDGERKKQDDINIKKMGILPFKRCK